MKFLLFSGLLLGGVFSALAQDLGTKPDVPSELDVTIDLGAYEPLYLISSMKTARIITKDQFEKIDAGQVDYIQVIKDPSSIYIYGEKARNGVVLVVMKGFSFSEKYSRKRKHK
jgi:hypothetical protein